MAEEIAAATNNNNHLPSDKERAKKVIELYFIQGKSTRYIAKELRMSLL